MILLLVAVLTVLWLVYKKYTAVYNTWRERGFAYEPAVFPLGSKKELPLFQTYYGYVYDDMYKKHAGKPYFGFYNMRTPFLVLRDLEMVKIVLAKEFSHFRDRRGVDVPKKDTLFNNLFNLEGERWRALRVKLSPTFTSGKLKGMYQHFITCAEVLDKFLLSNEGSVMDVKDITAKFNMNIISSCAFGMEINSIEESDRNPLREVGKSLGKSSSLKRKVATNLEKAFPQFAAFILKNFGNQKIGNTMLAIVGESVDYREKNGIKRNDFLDLLISLKNSKETLVADKGLQLDGKQPEPIEMTLELMTAQAFVFFAAGFETSSSVQSYCLYELALHPKIQDRLRKEIDTVTQKHGGLTYQAIQEMEYLDMVVSETMRKYPTLSHLNRRCTKAYTTPFGHRIEIGDEILIPIWSLHHDPENFPEPEKFDPERFSPANRDSIKPYSYIPFGEGPRMCIGMRFGQLQTKTGIITVLTKFSVEPSSDTPIPMKHRKGSSILTPPIKPILLRVNKLSATC